MTHSTQTNTIPRAFLFRRLQSLMGLFIVFFLIEHLLTNSQAALLFGDDGSGFVQAVNFIKNLPYLPVIEIMLLAIPFSIHIIWGLHYLFTSKQNCYGKNGGKTPHLPHYLNNHAYTWQRLTSWILLIGILGHVWQMRIANYPTSAKVGHTTYYAAAVSTDPGIYTVAKRLNVTLYTQEEIKKEKGAESTGRLGAFLATIKHSFTSNTPPSSEELLKKQEQEQKRAWLEALESWPLKPHEVIAVADNFGTIELMLVRDTFKSPTMIAFYTLFVLAACYHGFNGLWTFCITWGLTLTKKSQRQTRFLTTGLMALIAFLGLAAVWGTYWMNLKQ